MGFSDFCLRRSTAFGDAWGQQSRGSLVMELHWEHFVRLPTGAGSLMVNSGGFRLGHSGFLPDLALVYVGIM